MYQQNQSKIYRKIEEGVMIKQGLRIVNVFTILMCVFYSSALLSQSPDTAWTETYGGTEDDRFHSVQTTADNGYIIAGKTNSYGSGSADVYLIKTNANGNILWEKTYGGSDSDYGYSVQQTTDGGYIVAGYTGSFGAGGNDIYLIKTDADGDTLWTKTYGGTGSERGYSVQQTTDGGYIVTGITNSFGAGGIDFYLVKTDVDGDTLWTRTYGGTESDYGYSVQQTTDGGYIVAGYTKSFGAGYYDFYVIKSDANGDTLWTRTYGGTESEYGYSAQQTSDNGYIIAGKVSNDPFLVRTDANGDTLWTRIYDGKVANSVQQTMDNGFIFTGVTSSGGWGSNLLVVKTRDNGDTLWTRIYECAANGNDFGYSVQQTTDNGYIVAGMGRSRTGYDYDAWLLRIDDFGFMIRPSSIVFGSVPVDSSKTDSVAVTNTGSTTLNINSVVSNNSEFTVTPTTGSLIPGQSMKFYITFAPIDVGTEVGSIIFNHNFPTSPDTVTVAGIGVGIKEGKGSNLPLFYGLSQNSPNPFRTETEIYYQLSQPGVVTIAIYNISGQCIKTLTKENKKAGSYSIRWDGCNQDGKRESGGVYFCRMKVGEYTSVQKIVMLQ
jgi:hypothetical protein